MLRPGGRLVITDLDTHTNEWFRAEMSDVWLGFEREQVRAWFEQAGLADVSVDCTGQSCQAECQGEDESAPAVSIFVASGRKATSSPQV